MMRKTCVFVLLGALVFLSACLYDNDIAYLNDQVVALNRRVKSLEDGMDTKVRSGRVLNLAIGGSLALQVLTLVLPGLRGFLGAAAPTLIDVAVIGACALGPFALNETRKLAQSHISGEVTT